MQGLRVSEKGSVDSGICGRWPLSRAQGFPMDLRMKDFS